MDWKKIIENLKDKGFTQQEIARKCNCGQATISDILRGKTAQPGFALGQSLCALMSSSEINLKKAASNEGIKDSKS